MDPEEFETVKRYLYEATRYMEYSKMKQAKQDILDLLEKELEGKEYTEENIKEALNRMGNPYTLGKHYETQGNFLLSGRYYKFYSVMLKTTAVAMVVGQAVSFLRDSVSIDTLSLKYALESLLYNLLLTFFVTTVAFAMAEKIKTKRILKAVLEPWTTDSLEPVFQAKKLNLRMLLYIFLYTGVLGKLLTDFYEYHSIVDPGLLHLIPSLIFTIFIFRDGMRMTHTRRRELFYYMIFLFDGIALLLDLRLLQLLNGQEGFYSAGALLMFLGADLLKNIYDLYELKKLEK